MGNSDRNLLYRRWVKHIENIVCCVFFSHIMLFGVRLMTVDLVWFAARKPLPWL